MQQLAKSHGNRLGNAVQAARIIFREKRVRKTLKDHQTRVDVCKFKLSKLFAG